MEHRWNTRTPVALNIAVQYDKLGLISGRLRNLSLGGAFIEINAVGLARHTPVDVLLPAAGGDDEYVAVPAMVVRTEADGLAVQFTDFAPESIATLTSLMSEAGASQL